MKYLFLSLCFFLGASCMKSKEDYRQAIEDVQREQAIERQETMEKQEEEAAPSPVDRSRGSNDAEGMGMDE